MPHYVRPAIDRPPAIDDDGVPYGSRWDDADGLPEAAYSRTSHLERFAPLHAVADALVAHLAATHEVTVVEGPDPALADPHPDAVRSVRIAPRDGAGPTLTLELTAFPGVLLHVDQRMAEAFPPCGCDACDDRWEDVADHLEEAVLAAAGRLPPPPEPFGDLVS
ncbi:MULTISPECIES: DUF6226 family protein [Clavibacter]|uniref:Uncharacterized protein n=2 Tax=Clavibacter TaxID=1573 RepID=A0A399NIX9_9MICO|nr:MULTISPECIES: DUF6226 family protein [Clavibacter]KDP91102.1 hypothetical protein W824_07375 [Clavibacter cf. michiganensis LMG 26808]RII93974.1 hypothetical protein DZF96_15265 [Clavibacter michiganensis]UKF25700.1 DUF6226 family protein [Clavibacter sp. A6099]